MKSSSVNINYFRLDTKIAEKHQTLNLDLTAIFYILCYELFLFFLHLSKNSNPLSKTLMNNASRIALYIVEINCSLLINVLFLNTSANISEIKIIRQIARNSTIKILM